MVLLKRGGGRGGLQVVGFVKRGIQEQLDGYEGEYLALPLCFHQFDSTEPRRYVACAHSNAPVLLQPTQIGHAELAAALAEVNMYM
ncbi:hypothetical protein T492DRAFT_861001 [Pavlovales sp. CCMP2436]|nr:hypothetical protein T492DRAFT_861001 [Pavlovales sp. CCMP2436]